MQNDDRAQTSLTIRKRKRSIDSSDANGKQSVRPSSIGEQIMAPFFFYLPRDIAKIILRLYLELFFFTPIVHSPYTSGYCQMTPCDGRRPEPTIQRTGVEMTLYQYYLELSALYIQTKSEIGDMLIRDILVPGGSIAKDDLCLVLRPDMEPTPIRRVFPPNEKHPPYTLGVMPTVSFKPRKDGLIWSEDVNLGGISEGLNEFVTRRPRMSYCISVPLNGVPDHSLTIHVPKAIRHNTTLHQTDNIGEAKDSYARMTTDTLGTNQKMISANTGRGDISEDTMFMFCENKSVTMVKWTKSMRRALQFPTRIVGLPSNRECKNFSWPTPLYGPETHSPDILNPRGGYYVSLEVCYLGSTPWDVFWVFTNYHTFGWGLDKMYRDSPIVKRIKDNMLYDYAFESALSIFKLIA